MWVPTTESVSRMATATNAVTESTASAELTTSPMRSRCPRPSASAMNRVTPDCKPRSEMLRYPAETENASASVRIAIRVSAEMPAGLADDDEVGEAARTHRRRR